MNPGIGFITGPDRSRGAAPARRPVGACLLSAALLIIAGLAGCDVSVNGSDTSKVNGSIHVSPGKQPEPVSTVNGSIHIDDGAAVTSATTVNGGIHVGAHATAESLTTVNGSITLRPGARVSGSATTVRGALSLEDGAEVSGALSNVTGTITLTAARVGRGIKTVDGSISVTGSSHIDGGIRVEKPSGSFFHFGDTPRIVVGPGATVQGELKFERTVQLYVSPRATIGPVSGATPIAFDGDTP